MSHSHSQAHHCIYSNSPFFAVLLSMVLVTHGQPESQNIKWEISAINNLGSKLHTVLNSVMRSLAVWFHPMWDMIHPFVQHIHTICTSHPLAMGYQINCCLISVLMFKQSLFYSPQSTRVVMLIIPVCQKEAIKCFLKWKGKYSSMWYFEWDHSHISFLEYIVKIALYYSLLIFYCTICVCVYIY